MIQASMIRPVPISELSDIDMLRLRGAANREGHAVVSPTHAVMTTSGVPVGYAAVDTVPLVHIWLTKRASIFATRKMLRAIERELREQGEKWVSLPAPDDSPSKTLLEAEDYFPLTAPVRIYMKGLG